MVNKNSQTFLSHLKVCELSRESSIAYVIATISNSVGENLTTLVSPTCLTGSTRVVSGRASDVKFCSNTFTVVTEPIQPMFNMENLCLLVYGNCRCGEMDVKPKTMTITVWNLDRYDNNTLTRHLLSDNFICIWLKTSKYSLWLWMWYSITFTSVCMCTCQHCIAMPTDEQCRCCNEIQQVNKHIVYLHFNENLSYTSHHLTLTIVKWQVLQRCDKNHTSQFYILYNNHQHYNNLYFNLLSANIKWCGNVHAQRNARESVVHYGFQSVALCPYSIRSK